MSRCSNCFYDTEECRCHGFRELGERPVTCGGCGIVGWWKNDDIPEGWSMQFYTNPEGRCVKEGDFCGDCRPRMDFRPTGEKVIIDGVEWEVGGQIG